MNAKNTIKTLTVGVITSYPYYRDIVLWMAILIISAMQILFLSELVHNGIISVPQESLESIGWVYTIIGLCVGVGILWLGIYATYLTYRKTFLTT